MKNIPSIPNPKDKPGKEKPRITSEDDKANLQGNVASLEAQLTKEPASEELKISLLRAKLELADAAIEGSQGQQKVALMDSRAKFQEQYDDIIAKRREARKQSEAADQAKIEGIRKALPPEVKPKPTQEDLNKQLKRGLGGRTRV